MRCNNCGWTQKPGSTVLLDQDRETIRCPHCNNTIGTVAIGKINNCWLCTKCLKEVEGYTDDHCVGCGVARPAETKHGELKE